MYDHPRLIEKTMNVEKKILEKERMKEYKLLLSFSILFIDMYTSWNTKLEGKSSLPLYL